MAGRTKNPGMASDKAAIRKQAKYSKIKRSYHFVAFTVEGPWSLESADLFQFDSYFRWTEV